jgi:hypothetical protein
LSCFLRKKQDFLLPLQRKYYQDMVIAAYIRDKIESILPGTILTISDFNIEQCYQPALVKALNRMVRKGILQKVAKGKYYKPKATVFGYLRPPIEEIVKDYLEKDGRIVGYITGPTAFAAMGLTSQISSRIVIGSNKYRRPLVRGNYKVSFLVQSNVITKENVALLILLDAIRLIRQIPATTPDEVVNKLSHIIQAMTEEERNELCQLAMSYTPYVRALLGSILENAGFEVQDLYKTLNGVTTYKIPVTDLALPNKSKWNIV